MTLTSADFEKLIRRLYEHEVEFIVVGGVSAVMHGAPVVTFDLDIVHSRTAENIERLVRVLDSLNAEYRGQGDRVFHPTASHLATTGHHLLMTTLGPLDVLGTIGTGLGYEELQPHCDWVSTMGLRFLVMNLDTLIRIKEELGSEKDNAMLPVLRRTRDEKQHGSSEGTT